MIAKVNTNHHAELLGLVVQNALLVLGHGLLDQIEIHKVVEDNIKHE